MADPAGGERRHVDRRLVPNRRCRPRRSRWQTALSPSGTPMWGPRGSENWRAYRPRRALLRWAQTGQSLIAGPRQSGVRIGQGGLSRSERMAHFGRCLRPVGAAPAQRNSARHPLVAAAGRPHIRRGSFDARVGTERGAGFPPVHQRVCRGRSRTGATHEPRAPARTGGVAAWSCRSGGLRWFAEGVRRVRERRTRPHLRDARDVVANAVPTMTPSAKCSRASAASMRDAVAGKTAAHSPAPPLRAKPCHS
jgi:hypothetical protein